MHLTPGLPWQVHADGHVPGQIVRLNGVSEHPAQQVVGLTGPRRAEASGLKLSHPLPYVNRLDPTQGDISKGREELIPQKTGVAGQCVGLKVLLGPEVPLRPFGQGDFPHRRVDPFPAVPLAFPFRQPTLRIQLPLEAPRVLLAVGCSVSSSPRLRSFFTALNRTH